ncbi:unnamed protein product [Chondrus crispus]|uniref:DUF547 domain-containing protein n=1 Tax=Chondrus crispus TaxID=2769 RepID=R7Q2K5_CHOCR|nr:unnamed protein product [Chondrus crispus]CDF32113.1 unnamed protein product [Chondrus crispus]|eukprot:XP_005711778.1 unnamed protein product [Chondrus crispus]
MTPPPPRRSLAPRPDNHLCDPLQPSPWDSSLSSSCHEPESLHFSFNSRPEDMTVETSFVDVVDALDGMMAPVPARLPTSKTKWNGVKAYSSTGFQIVTWLLNAGFASSRSAAAELARQLVRAGGLIPTFRVESANQAFNGSQLSNYVHRGLSCHIDRGLNSTLIYPGKPRHTIDVLTDLNKSFARVFHVAVSTDGHFVDYAAIRGSAGWRETLVLLAELAISDDTEVASSDPDVRKAAFYNLYNVLIFHAKLVFGHPMDLVKRGKFFNDASYVIAGKKITSVELEHQVLRLRINPNDPRAGWLLAEKDPRMHFILNCGAWSCPPLIALDANRTEEMLQEATERFLEKYCVIDLQNRKVTLSRLFKWFRNDFTPGSDSDADLIKWISQRASKTKMNELTELLVSDYKVKFAVYNWADNGDGSAKPDIRFMTIYDLSFAKTA